MISWVEIAAVWIAGPLVRFAILRYKDRDPELLFTCAGCHYYGHWSSWVAFWGRLNLLNNCIKGLKNERME